ncbi:MAG: DNA polymerase III subunit delta', partial [Flavobacteriales bacterium]
MRFADVIGHDALKHRLLGNLQEGRVSHAQLFLGAPGSGALPLALAYTSLLLCERPLRDDCCGECPSCVKSSKLVHPDVLFSFPIITREKLQKPTSNDFVAEFREAVLARPYLN